MKDISLKINSLPLNSCFSYRNVLQDGVNPLSKIVLKTRSFVKKFKILYILDHMTWFKFRQYLVQIRITYFMERLPVSAFAMVAWKSLNGKFTAKTNFPIGHFMLPLLTLTLKF